MQCIYLINILQWFVLGRATVFCLSFTIPFYFLNALMLIKVGTWLLNLLVQWNDSLLVVFRCWVCLAGHNRSGALTASTRRTWSPSCTCWWRWPGISELQCAYRNVWQCRWWWCRCMEVLSLTVPSLRRSPRPTMIWDLVEKGTPSIPSLITPQTSCKSSKRWDFNQPEGNERYTIDFWTWSICKCFSK